MEIEKGVPLPDYAQAENRRRCPEARLGKRGPTPVYPFNAMEVGDSILFENAETEGQKAYQTAKKCGQRWGRKFIRRKDANGIRIWRVE